MVLFHYYICAQMTGLRNNGVNQKAWADYLFPNFDEDNFDFTCLAAISKQEIEEWIARFGTNAMLEN